MSDLGVSEDIIGERAIGQAADDLDGVQAPTGSRFWGRFRRNKLALAAGGFLILELLLLLMGPLITTHDPNLATSFADFLKGPGTEYWWVPTPSGGISSPGSSMELASPSPPEQLLCSPL